MDTLTNIMEKRKNHLMDKIGFTCSCFDLLHAGHILMLKDARKQCHYLIVGLQIDPSIDFASASIAPYIFAAAKPVFSCT